MPDPSQATDPQDNAIPRRKAGHPAIATTVAAVVALMALLPGRAASLATGSLAERVGYIVGGVVFGAILWAIAYAITIRRASRGWKIGSLMLLVLLGTLGALARLDGGSAFARADVDATADQLAAAMKQEGGAQPVRAGPAAGPLARMSARTTNLMIADARAFNAEAEASGASAIVTLRDLTKRAPVLEHCERIAMLAGRAAQVGSNYPTYIGAARAEGEAAVKAGELGRPALDGFIEGLAGTRPAYERQWALLGQTATDSAALCRVLARRHWETDASGQVRFSDPDDLQEAKVILGRIRTANEQIAAMRKANAEASQHELKALRAR
jgi:hypothetical protein